MDEVSTLLKPAPASFVGKSYHFIGIGGIGMSSMARLLLSWGAFVSGSDRVDSSMLDQLRQEGARVTVGHSAANLQGDRALNFVVYSKAIPEDNPELAEARKSGIETMHRAELLGRLMSSRQGVCVCGTHGKTTTTAMLASILTEIGQDPVVMLGGEYAPLGGNVRSGNGQVFVSEACEAYDSFLSLYPDFAVVTNIEPDHVDEDHPFEHIRQSFRTFLSRIPTDGVVIACANSPEVIALLPELTCRVETYGMNLSHDQQSPDWHITPSVNNEREIYNKGHQVGKVILQVPGDHNASNALGAIAAAHSLGVPVADAAALLARFSGVDRRFSVRGIRCDIMVVDDYAHHPSEIRATMVTARELLRSRANSIPSPIDSAMQFRPYIDSRILVAFQPHLYSRTQQFMNDFTEVFEEADAVVIAEIYAAREAPIDGVSGSILADRIHARWPDKQVVFVPRLEDISGRLLEIAKPGDLILTMGAGSITEVATSIIHLLDRQEVAT